MQSDDAQEIIHHKIKIEPARQGSYFTIPFQVGQAVEKIEIIYRYGRHAEDTQQQGALVFVARQEVNIIDIGLIAPDGSQVGASGSDKSQFFVSETGATPGYYPCRIVPGEWQILVGAYKVQPGGVEVWYEIRMTLKRARWLKGDFHTHTLASDGVHTAEELAWKAKRNGLDFIAITDHNQMVSMDMLPHVPGVTLIPGVEWTHYQGHANFLGVDRPFDGCFATNTLEEAQARFTSARERGAVITINHPFEEGCGFAYDLNAMPFDCLEVWNGPMRESNLRAIGLWQSLLVADKKIPACGGSDYHRDHPFILLGGPTTCLFSHSAGVSDILEALRRGRSYLVFSPQGPELEMRAGEAGMGDTVRWPECSQLEIDVEHLLAGDVVRVVTGRESQVVWKAPSDGRLELVYPMSEPGFARVEVLRSFLPGLPLLPALLSNPIYFEPG